MRVRGTESITSDNESTPPEAKPLSLSRTGPQTAPLACRPVPCSPLAAIDYNILLPRVQAVYVWPATPAQAALKHALDEAGVRVRPSGP